MIARFTDSLNPPRAILFDLDDTLVTFDQNCEAAWAGTCARFAPEAGMEAAELRRVIGEVSSAYWSDPDRHREGRLALEETRRTLVSRALAGIGVRDNTLAHRIADHYSRLQESMISLFPDAVSTLGFFKQRNMKMALVTNGNALMQRRKIERFKLETYVTHCFVEGELGFGKPDPRVFTAALRALDVDASLAWCIGDNLDWDVRGAQAVGIAGIWKDAKGRGMPEGPIRPDHVITELRELIDLYRVVSARPRQA